MDEHGILGGDASDGKHVKAAQSCSANEAHASQGARVSPRGYAQTTSMLHTSNDLMGKMEASIAAAMELDKLIMLLLTIAMRT